MKKLNFTFLIVLFCAFFVNAQNGDQVIEINSRVKYQWIGKYDLKKINSILTDDAKEFSKYDVTYNPGKNGVNLYRITYQSIIPEFNNRTTWASGLIAIPDNAKGKMPVLSYQHGTVFGKTDVPSFPDESAEIRLTLANFAGNGYVVIAADNFGKGTSTEYDAYQIKSSTQQADIDMYFAAQDVLKSMNLQQSSLFLSGWSMGSWSTLMFIQKLQELNISVKAAYVACLPSDIYALVNFLVEC